MIFLLGRFPSHSADGISTMHSRKQRHAAGVAHSVIQKHAAGHTPLCYAIKVLPRCVCLLDSCAVTLNSHITQSSTDSTRSPASAGASSNSGPHLHWLAVKHSTASGVGGTKQHGDSSISSVSSISSTSRRLQQLAICPVGCLDDACAEDAFSGGLRCMKCQDTLVVDRITGLCGKQHHDCWPGCQ